MIIGVVGKGGVGKTTVAINLATALTNLGKDIILVDGNFQNPHVGLYLGKADVQYTVREVIRNQDASQALLVHSSGLHVISGDIAGSEQITAWHLDRLKLSLEHAEVPVFLDLPPGAGKDLLSIVDSVLVVTTPDLIAVTDAYKTIRLCTSLQKEILGVIVNRCAPGQMMTIENIQSMLEQNVLGLLPEEDAVKASMRMRHPVVYSHPRSRISRAFVAIAKHLAGYEEHVFERLRTIR